MQGRRTVELLADLVTRLHHLPRRKLTLLVGIDGPRSGRFAADLAGCDPSMIVVALSGFRTASQGSAAVDLDWRRLRNEVLLPLHRNSAGRLASLTGERQVGVGGIVLIEGVGAGVRQLASAYDYLIWVATPDEQEGWKELARTPNLLVEYGSPVEHDPSREYVQIRPADHL